MNNYARSVSAFSWTSSERDDRTKVSQHTCVLGASGQRKKELSITRVPLRTLWFNVLWAIQPVRLRNHLSWLSAPTPTFFLPTLTFSLSTSRCELFVARNSLCWYSMLACCIMQARSHVSQIAQSKQSRSKKKKRRNRKRKKKQKTKETKKRKAIPVRKIMDDPPENASPIGSVWLLQCACYGAPFCASEVCDGDVHDILQAAVILCYPPNLFAEHRSILASFADSFSCLSRSFRACFSFSLCFSR